MDIQEVHYIGSFEREGQCPMDGLPEYAFIGRSNVGKSSLINYLCDRKDLARVSKTPGKTTMMNYFKVDNSWYIVDLPGYGYARRSKKQRAKWEQMLERYLLVRSNLHCVFLLIDSRIDHQKVDREFMSWLGERRIPFVIVFTKIDGVKPAKRDEKVEAIRQDMLESWTELPQHFITSTVLKEGKEEILAFVRSYI